MELLIKGARIVDFTKDFIGDVYIKDGKISEIDSDIDEKTEVINGKGYVLMPAFVDLHCHFRDPGFTYKEDIESGSKAAAKGGYTTVNLMANTKPVCSSMETVEYVLEKAKALNLIDIHQCVSITRDLDGKDLTHLDQLDRNKVRFLSDDGKGVGNTIIMMKAMEKAKEIDVTILSHAETPELSSIDMRLAENVMTSRDIELARHTGCKLHMAHVSTREAMKYVIDGKKSGANITCEVTPHHIALTEKTNYRVNPPLRKQEDIDFLIGAIKNGYVDAIGTDHAPHSTEDKQNGAPGISGIETAFGVCFSMLVRNGHISLSRLSELMSKKPSEIIGINKGKIEKGYDGDLVLIDTEESYKVDVETFESKGKNSPFHGMELYGRVVCTIKAGKVIYSK